MEAFLLHYGLLDQQIPPHKSHIGKGPQSPFVPRSNYGTHNPFDVHSTGLLQTPPPLLTHSYSLPQQPLLPTPAAFHRHRSSSTPLSNNRTGDSKKSKSPRKKTPKKLSSGALTVALTKPSRPDQSRAAPMDITGNVGRTTRSVDENKVDMFSGSMMFAVSPPPSSLPFPSFLRRGKLSCNAEAAGSVDNVANDNLRRLLQLRKHAL